MTLMVDLTGRRVLVTGGAGGLGASIVRTLAGCGAKVLAVDHDGQRLAELRDQAGRDGSDVEVLAGDLIDDAADLPARAADVLGGLDGLVNAAGVMHTTPLPELSVREWREVVDLDLTAVFRTVQRAGQLMTDGDGGAIVSLASVAGRSARPDAAHYAAAKAGLISLTKSAAVALAPRVRVNAVAPGVFLTPMWDAIMADRDQRFGAGAGRRYLDEVGAQTPLGRVGRPPELATVVAFLLCDLSAYITGQTINVCGGLEMD